MFPGKFNVSVLSYEMTLRFEDIAKEINRAVELKITVTMKVCWI